MLIHVAPNGTRSVRKLDGSAQIVIELNEQGEARLQAFFRGRFDSNYRVMTDQRLLQHEIPKLLAELRDQIKSSGSA